MLLAIIGRVVVEAADGREGHQFRLGVALLDRLDRLFGRHHARLLARTGVFQLHVLVHIEPRRIEAQPLRDDLADRGPRLATTGAGLFRLGNIQHDPPPFDVLGELPPAVALRRQLARLGGFLCDCRNDGGRCRRCFFRKLEQRQLVRIEPLTPRPVDSPQQQVEPMLQLLDLPLRCSELLVLLENDRVTEGQVGGQRNGFRAHVLLNTAAAKKFRAKRKISASEIRLMRRAVGGIAFAAARSTNQCHATGASVRWPTT